MKQVAAGGDLLCLSTPVSNHTIRCTHTEGESTGGLANTACHWNTGVMVADNGPLYAYVDIPLKISCFKLQ